MTPTFERVLAAASAHMARLAEGAKAPESGAPVKVVSAEGMTVVVAEPG